MFVVDCPLTDNEGGQLLSNGEEKLAERMVKDLEPRKSIGWLNLKTGWMIRKGASVMYVLHIFKYFTFYQDVREKARRRRRMI